MKKMLFLMPLLMIALLFVTACGAGDDPVEPAATPAPGVAVPTAPPEVPEGFEGPFYLAPLPETMTIRIGVGFGDPGPTVRPGITPDLGAHNQFIYDNIGIDFYYMWVLPTAQANERFDLALATGEIPDFMALSAVRFFELAEHGQLRCLRAAFDRYARPEIKEMFESLDNNAPLEIATVNGELLAIPHVLDPSQNLVLVWYRGDWADSLGFSTPTTMDELETMMQSFVDNEMGGPGTRGIGLFADPVHWAPDARAVFHGYNSYVGGSAGNWIQRGGQLVNALVQPETQNALDRLRSWYASGIIHPEFATHGTDQITAELAAGRIGVISGEWWLGHWGGVVAGMQYDPNVEWRVTSVVPAAGADRNTIKLRANINNFRALSADAPEGAEVALIKMLNWFWELYFVVGPFKEIEDYFFTTGEPGAFTWSWWPSLIWNAYEQQMNFDMVNEAIRLNDHSDLISQFQIDLFNAYQMLFNDAQFDDFWGMERAWGEWFTRVCPTGGWGMNVQINNSGAYEVAEFTGPPTPTHVSRGSILHDMWLEFYVTYIMGEIPESEWDVFVTNWHNLGGADWTAEINEQFNSMQE